MPAIGLFSIFIVVALLICSFCQIIELEYMDLSSSYVVKYFLEKEKKYNDYFMIDLRFDYSLITSRGYTPTKKFVNTTLNIFGERREGIQFNGTLLFPSKEFNITMPIYLIDTEISEGKFITSFLGLSYKVDNEEYSFVHFLKKHNKISKLSFGFDRNSFSYEFKPIYFGGIPSELRNKYKYQAFFKVNETYKTWGVDLEKVTFSCGGKNYSEYINTNYTYLNVNTNLIFAPRSFFAFINQTYFNQLYQNQTCTYRISSDTSEYITCFLGKIVHFPEFTFVIGGYKFSFLYDSLFTIYDRGDFASFNIHLNLKDKEEKWMIGFSLTEKYCVNFDYEEKMITFYDSRPFELNNNNKLCQKMYNFLSLLLGASCISLLFHKLKYNVKK